MIDQTSLYLVDFRLYSTPFKEIGQGQVSGRSLRGDIKVLPSSRSLSQSELQARNRLHLPIVRAAENMDNKFSC